MILYRTWMILIATGCYWSSADVAVAQGPKEKLLIVIKTGPEIDQKKMRDSIQNALKAISPSGNYIGTVVSKEPEVKPITAATYNAYASLENPDFRPVEVPKSRTGRVEVRQLNKENLWEFNLLEGEPELTKLTIRYKDKPDEPVEYVPSRRIGDPLTMTQFGSYALKADPDRIPLDYTASIKNLEQSDIVEEKGSWPQGSNFYLIRLEDFRNQYQDAFAEAIQNKNKVGSALKSFDIRTNVTLAIGDAEAGSGRRDRARFEGNRLYVSVPPLDQAVSQAYIFFPLDAEQAQKETDRLNKMGENELAQHIRAQKVIQPNEAAIIRADMEPVWIELPKVDVRDTGLTFGDYGRVLSLINSNQSAITAEEYKKLLDRFGKQNPHWVVVYEFENPSKKIRTAITTSLDADSPAQKANHEAVNLWTVTLQQLAGLKAPTRKE